MSAIVVSEVAMPADTKMVTTLMEVDLLRRVDDFRFEQRFPSRAAAMKWLMDAALNAGLKPTARERERWS